MDNLNNSTQNIINNSYSQILEITDSLNNNTTNISNNSSIITLANTTLLENNQPNTILSSELIQSKTTLYNQNYSSTNLIPNSILQINNDNTHSIKSTIYSNIYKSTYINNNIINNLFNNSTILKTELEPIKSSEILFETKINNTNITKTAINTTTNNLDIELNITSNSSSINNQSKPFLPKNINIPIINKTYDTNLVLGLGISIPIILVILIILICYYIRKKRKAKMSSVSNLDINRINFSSQGAKLPYNKLQNTSNLNAGMNANNMSMSEIKVQNLKDEIHSIITNSSGGSNSSGKRKREKKRGNKNNNKNNNDLNNVGNKGNQNNIKDQINQYAIDEKNN